MVERRVMYLPQFRPVRILCALCWLLLYGSIVWAQAPTSIQFFMPGGGLPSRPLRFTLTLPDGRQEILFTDTKGKFPLTSDLVRDGDYSLVIEGDKRTFE